MMLSAVMSFTEIVAVAARSTWYAWSAVPVAALPTASVAETLAWTFVLGHEICGVHIDAEARAADGADEVVPIHGQGDGVAVLASPPTVPVTAIRPPASAALMMLSAVTEFTLIVAVAARSTWYARSAVPVAVLADCVGRRDAGVDIGVLEPVRRRLRC